MQAVKRQFSMPGLNFLRKSVDVQTVSFAMSSVSAQQEEQSSANYDKIVKWIICIGVFLLPLFFLPWTTEILELNKQLLLVLIAGIGLVTWMLGVVTSGRVRIALTIFDAGALSILVTTLIATIFSLDAGKSLFGLVGNLSDSFISVAACALIYFLIVWTFRDKNNCLYGALIFSTILALTYALLQIFGVHILHGFTASRAFNTIGSVNTVGVFAAILLPLLIKANMRIKKVRFISISAIAAMLGFLLLVLLNWWVLWVIVCLGMLALIAFDSIIITLAKQNTGRKFRISRFLIPMLIVVSSVFLIVVQFSIPAVKNNLPVEILPSFSFSLDVTGSVLGDRLLTGYGPENFSLAFDSFGAGHLANSQLSDARFFDSMSQAITWVVDGGIIALIALALFILPIVAAIIMFRRRIISCQDNAGILSGTLAATIASLTALFLYPFNITLLTTLFILMALTTLLMREGTDRVIRIEERPAYSIASSLGFIVGLIIILTGVYFVSARYTADIVYAKALKAKETDKAVEYLVRAINWSGSQDRFYRSLSQATILQIDSELGKTGNNDQDQQTKIQNLISSAITIAKRATEIAPLETDNWFNLGTVYQALFGLVEDVDGLAEEAYLKASSLRPGDPMYQNKIGMMYLTKADFLSQLARSAGQNGNSLNQQSIAALLRAEEAFKKSIELSNNFGTAIYNLGAVYDRQGKVGEAIKQIEKIAPFNANQPNLMFELGLLYYRANRKDDAFKALQRAIILSPDFANARWYIALIYEERQDISSAIEQLQKILETNKDNQTVLDKLAKLQQGKRSIPPEKVMDQKPL